MNIPIQETVVEMEPEPLTLESLKKDKKVAEPTVYEEEEDRRA